MGAFVVACWICGAMTQQIIHTEEGLKEFYRYGPLCEDHLVWARREDKKK
jgi:hypothetical protein